MNHASRHRKSPFTIRNSPWAVAFILLCGTSIVYFLTLCRTIYWGDGPELSAVAYILGIPHPTGYPLFTLLGKIATLLPLDNVALEINLMCAFFCALSSVLFFLCAREVFDRLPAIYFPNEYSRTAAAAGAALLVAFSYTWWNNATFAEVYSLTCLFIIGSFYLYLLFTRTRKVGFFYALFYVSGLAMAHHRMALVILPFLISAVVFHIKRSLGARRLVQSGIFAVFVFILGWTPYLCLPIRAHDNPAINWGAPDTLNRFIWVFTGGEFKTFRLLQSQPGEPFDMYTYLLFFTQRSREFSYWIVSQMFPLPFHAKVFAGVAGLVVMLLFILGIGICLALLPSIAITVVAAFFLNLMFIFVYNIPDIQAYFLASYPFIVLICFVGLVFALAAAETALLKKRRAVLPVLYLLLPLVPLVCNYPLVDKSAQITPREYAHRVLNALPENALIITHADFDIFPLWYTQIAEKTRTDVTIVGNNFTVSGWYSRFFDEARQQKSELTLDIRDEDPKKLRELSFYRMFAERVIEPNIDHFPMFTTFFAPVLSHFYTLKPYKTVLSESDYNIPESSFLPMPVIFKLERNEN